METSLQCSNKIKESKLIEPLPQNEASMQSGIDTTSNDHTLPTEYLQLIQKSNTVDPSTSNITLSDKNLISPFQTPCGIYGQGEINKDNKSG